MPQFDPSSYSEQLFWLAILFVALYVVMARLVLPRIGAVLDERQRRIDDNLDRAGRLKLEAEEVAVLYEQALTKARTEAGQALKETHERLEQETARRQKELGERLEEKIKAGEARIAEAKSQALTEVRDVAVETARLASSRLTGLSFDNAGIAAAVEAVIEERA
ncbi:MAG: F0F1 ATP synthase subunit B' [Rhodospirillaceae bacterium]|nr:F0F1 ATP synthase subunit B' [Rhodospirillaceae bacterium]